VTAIRTFHVNSSTIIHNILWYCKVYHTRYAMSRAYMPIPKIFIKFFSSRRKFYLKITEQAKTKAAKTPKVPAA